MTNTDGAVEDARLSGPRLSVLMVDNTGRDMRINNDRRAIMASETDLHEGGTGLFPALAASKPAAATDDEGTGLFPESAFAVRHGDVAIPRLGVPAPKSGGAA